MTDHKREAHGVQKRKEQIEKKRRIKKAVGAGVLLILLIAVFQIVTAAVRGKNTEITIKAESVTVKQGEELPSLKAEVSYVGKETSLKKKVLDKKSGYTKWDLIQELKKGEHYQISCAADGQTEGKYSITIELSEELARKAGKEWNRKITIHTKKAVLTVQNRVGEWVGERFRKWDGTYVEEDFVEVRGKTYYFGENGKKATGWQQLGAIWYCFDEDGVMQKNTWMDKEDGRAYLAEDGKAASGWVDMDGATYYFHQSGLMAVGKEKIGTAECVFGEDGKLQSKKSKIDPNKPMMALTFDDGPGERTGEILDMLEKYNAHATFFMLGTSIPGKEALIKQMLEIGCELGNHSYNHPELTKVGAAGVRAQIGDTNQRIKKACGQAATVMRPPYGAVNDMVKENVGMPMILWNIDTLDWKTLDTLATIDNVRRTADDGDIVLMHDIHSPTVDAALKLIPELIEEGYQLVTVSEMAEARGIHMAAGEVFTDFNK